LIRQIGWLIVWLPLIGFLFNAASGLLIRNRETQKRVVAYVAPGVVLLAFAVSLAVCAQLASLPGHRAIVPMIPGASPDTPWIDIAGFRANFALLVDPLSVLMALIVTGVGGLIHVYATGYMADDPEQPRFFTYFNLFIFMMLTLVMAENFLLMFVGWEGVGTCSYLLISFWYKSVDNSKAGNKAFIVNRVGDVGFALGMMAIWSTFGTLSFFTRDRRGVMDLAAQHLAGNGQHLGAVPAILGIPAITAICVLLFIGATGKSAQIPLWVWLPDAMAGPTPVSALIHAATMVTAGVVMLARCSWLYVQAPAAMQIVGWIGVLTAFLGATIGLVQNDIKRVLAFSTISQLGYMVLACGVGNFTAGMFHVTTHAFFKALLFLGSGAVIHSMLGEQDMRKMGGLKKRIASTWFVMVVGTYAIAGIPLLSGFWSKDEILDSALRSPWGSNVALYAIGLVTAFMTAFYMNRLMWKTFDVEPQFVDGELPHQHQSNFDDDEHAAHGEHTGHEEKTEGGEAHEGQAEAEGHGKSQIHTSPPSMMLPLYLLAALSLAAGAALGPTGIFERFLGPSIAPLSLGRMARGEEVFTPMTGYVISSVVAILGILIAHVLYRRGRATGHIVPAQVESAWVRNPRNIFAYAYVFLLNKWQWDWLYNTLFIRVGGWFADRVLWRIVDQDMIDGLLVNGVGGGVAALAAEGRKWQSGRVRTYALGMLLGVVAIVTGLIASWSMLAK
jgi:NADH-quinone oxidoreductase subunit L